MTDSVIELAPTVRSRCRPYRNARAIDGTYGFSGIGSFNCTPRERFLNLNVGGRTVSFAENVFYEFLDERIVQVWSVIDKAAIEAQLLPHPDASDA